MVMWVVILARGLRQTLPNEHPGNMPWLFMYSALSIPLFYAAGLVFWKNASYAVVGVYGMLAMGFFMFVARYFIPYDKGSERAMKWSFWSLNIGLAWMLFVNLVPLGILQLNDSFRYGYWHAREMGFFLQPAVRVIEWLRMPGDVLFIVGGILPVVYLAVRMFANRHRPDQIPAEAGAEPFTEVR